MSEDTFFPIFKKYLPPAAVDYCYKLWKTHDFHFKITQNRKSKFGDYHYKLPEARHVISVNASLNPYAFLLTYIHEVAHLTTCEKQMSKKKKRRILPHGEEWKYEFQKLMLPVLREEVFPIYLLLPLQQHMLNPKASSSSDPELSIALHKYDRSHEKVTYLRDIQEGQRFVLKNEAYKKIKLRRTRSLCEFVNDGRKYLIAESAPVKAV